MAVNTEQQNDGKFVTTSSISIVGGPSRTTLKAEDVVGTSTLSTAALTVATLVATSTASVGGNTTLTGTLQVNSTTSLVGALSAGAVTANSTASIGGAVTMQGAAQVRSALTAIGWLYAGVFLSSATTAQSGATSKISQQGQLYFSVLSLDTNGGEFGFRSGNTVYRFASVAVG